ncbi:MAG: diphthine synthase [Nanohaloarchaea archaeon]|nr:diphthine synthase [Candidatus Nanohaloarchaea archaeon]
MLYIVGLGLDDGEVTQKGLEALENAEKVFAEFYTNTETIDLAELEEEAGKNIEKLSREEVEREDKIIGSAKETDTAFLVSGNALTATTHYDIKHRAEEKGIDVEVVHAPSIFTSIAETGLNVYKFGRTVTLPKKGEPSSIVKHIEKNDSIDLHTLVLLDIDYDASEAAEKLVSMEESLGSRKVVVLERANLEDQNISVMKLEGAAEAEFGGTPHSIIFVGETSHKEEEFLSAHS